MTKGKKSNASPIEPPKKGRPQGATAAPPLQFDNQKIKGRIYELYDTMGAFSKTIDMSQAYFSYKLRGTRVFTRDEIYKISQALEIKKEDFFDYFFTLAETDEKW